MRTLLSEFSNALVGSVRPLLGPLEEAARAVARAGPAVDGDASSGELLRGLRDLRHELGVLVEKVAGQQAYLLIFGPLKSGKSTLMNATCASYVSEVTALPAYPCMVYVSHAAGHEFVVHRYDGRTEKQATTELLHERIRRDHAALAERMRATEAGGADFDPALHLPEAIRKIEVKVPAGELEQSGAVMVDTPGLYSRMKFGYDRMTREFRNSAACALFVVKSDNLFLEQVFQEFGQLLELFSRIFLVVNVDSQKRDLGPEGELVPSLEQTDPRSVVEAFEELAMTAPLRQAREEGRLHIHAVDLLRAASARLRAARGEDVETPADFELFRDDLSRYLNGPEYLRAFVADSLRRAESLSEEAGALARANGVAALRRRHADLEREAAEARERAAAAQALASAPWDERVRTAVDAVRAELRTAADAGLRRAVLATRERIDAWFGTDGSLARLDRGELQPLAREHASDVDRRARELVSERASTGASALALDDETRERTALAGIDAAEGVRASARAVAEPAEGRAEGGDRSLALDGIPVRRRLVDWLLLRRASAVRRRVLGPDDAPERDLAPEEKESRLGEPGRNALQEAAEGLLRERHRAALASAEREVLAPFAEALARWLEGEAVARRDVLAAFLRRTDERRSELGSVLARVDDVAATSAAVAGDVRGLAPRYRSAEPDLLRDGAPSPEERRAEAEGEELELRTRELQPEAPPRPRSREAHGGASSGRVGGEHTAR